MDIEDMISKFSCDHPVLTWILARLVFCTCVSLVIVIALFGIVVLIYPVVRVAQGYGFEAFKIWFCLPLIATVIWACVSAANFVLEEVIW